MKTTLSTILSTALATLLAGCMTPVGPPESGTVATLIHPESDSSIRALLVDLPRSFRNASGESLDIIRTDNVIAFIAPLSAYFNEQSPAVLDTATKTFATEIAEIATTFTRSARVRIDSRDRQSASHQLYTVAQWLARTPGLDPHRINTEFSEVKSASDEKLSLAFDKR